MTEKQYEILVERFTNRIDKANTYCLKKLGEEIDKINKMSADKRKTYLNSQEFKSVVSSVKNYLARQNVYNINDIKEVNKEVSNKVYKDMKKYYIAGGIAFIALANNKKIDKIVSDNTKDTTKEYLKNVVTPVFKIPNKNGNYVDKKIEDTFNYAIESSINATLNDKVPYEEQVSATIKNLAKSGIRTTETGTPVIDYASGRSVRLDSVVRQSILSNLRQLENDIRIEGGDQFGADGVEITAHANCAIDHQDVQGRQYTFEEYEKLNSRLDRPISTLNCYHMAKPIKLGVSSSIYTDEELKEMTSNNNKGFDYEGVHYTGYEGTQVQRYLERKIREQKDLLTIAKASGSDKLASETRKNITMLGKKYADFSNKAGLQMKPDRLKIVK